MTGSDALLRRVDRLRAHLVYLRQRQQVPLGEYLADEDLQAAVERRLQLALEAALDIGNHLITARGLRPAETYRQVILRLGEAGILPADFAERFAPAAGFRNILVHDYLDLNPEWVYRHLQSGLADLELYLQYVTDAL